MESRNLALSEDQPPILVWGTHQCHVGWMPHRWAASGQQGQGQPGCSVPAPCSPADWLGYAVTVHSSPGTAADTPAPGREQATITEGPPSDEPDFLLPSSQPASRSPTSYEAEWIPVGGFSEGLGQLLWVLLTPFIYLSPLIAILSSHTFRRLLLL